MTVRDSVPLELVVVVVEPLTEGEADTQAVALAVTEAVSIGLVEGDVVPISVLDAAGLSVTEPVVVRVVAIERVTDTVTELVRVLVVEAVTHAEAFVVGDPFGETEPEPETVLVFEVVTEAVDVWLAELVTEGEPVVEPLAEALWAGLLLADAEALTVVVPLEELDTEPLPLSL